MISHMEYIDNNRINPLVYHEVCHGLELMVADQFKARLIVNLDLIKNKLGK